MRKIGQLESEIKKDYINQIEQSIIQKIQNESTSIDNTCYVYFTVYKNNNSHTKLSLSVLEEIREAGYKVTLDYKSDNHDRYAIQVKL